MKAFPHQLKKGVQPDKIEAGRTPQNGEIVSVCLPFLGSYLDEQACLLP